ncbi:MAG: glycosyltransferase [Candidatus Limnocylindrales bacterium]
MTDRVSPEIWEAAKQRAEARAGHDWATADRLRAEIEAAGWRVVDTGSSFRLEPAAVDVEVEGEIRYGSSDAVPSRLLEPPEGLASIVLVASTDPDETRRALDSLASGVPEGVDVVLVADGLPDRALGSLRASDLAGRQGVSVELVRTSAVLGHGAALNIGIRRSRAPVVIVLDPCIVPGGDIVSPLVRALDDPSVAIAGPFGLVSADLRRFEESASGADVPSIPAGATGPAGPGTTAADAAAIQGYLMAFRRSDAIGRGPLDEGFRFYRNVDIWWSLVLRDEGEETPPRRAVTVPGLLLTRGEPRAWTGTPPAERDRLSKRNFYRVLDRFRTRLDLAVPVRP